MVEILTKKSMLFPLLERFLMGLILFLSRNISLLLHFLCVHSAGESNLNE